MIFNATLNNISVISGCLLDHDWWRKLDYPQNMLMNELFLVKNIYQTTIHIECVQHQLDNNES